MKMFALYPVKILTQTMRMFQSSPKFVTQGFHINTVYFIAWSVLSTSCSQAYHDSMLRHDNLWLCRNHHRTTSVDRLATAKPGRAKAEPLRQGASKSPTRLPAAGVGNNCCPSSTDNGLQVENDKENRHADKRLA